MTPVSFCSMLPGATWMSAGQGLVGLDSDLIGVHGHDSGFEYLMGSGENCGACFYPKMSAQKFGSTK